MPDSGDVPAGRVLKAAQHRNAALGHENLGPLSSSHGFIGVEPPAPALPPPFDEWVAIADELPELVSTLRLRRRLDSLPLLDASARSLDDRYLLRAGSVISLLSQAYHNIPMRPPDRLPKQLANPWLQISERLERPAWTFTTVDFIFHNWRLVDPDVDDPMRAENVALLNNVWDQADVDRFMLVSLEILAVTTPLVGCVVRAQEACRRRDHTSLGRELALAADIVRKLAYETFPKISANAHSGIRRVDPVIWAKLFAFLPLPLKDAKHVLNASGIELPAFGLLDNLLGRRAYETELGAKARSFRNAYPRHWREFLDAILEEPIIDYVRGSGDRELIGLLDELSEAYQGQYGLIARHRLMSFGFMDAAFKSGRPSTVTGFSGLFEARAWETVDASFEAARLERLQGSAPPRRLARVAFVGKAGPGVSQIVLDVRGLGLHCRPGDRLAVLPQNSAELVARTLRALRATGEELVDLTPEWVEALSSRLDAAGANQALLRDVLAYGHIRPVSRATAKLLHGLTLNANVRLILEARTEDQWELWDLLELLAGAGFAPQRLWRAERGDFESLCRVVPPLSPRLYSISGIAAGEVSAEHLELTVGQLRYDSAASATSVTRARRGTASTFLGGAITVGDEVPVAVVRPVGFSLPHDSVPIVMFAGGTGVAPFREFLRVRTEVDGTENMLFAAARTADSLPYREEFAAYARGQRVEVHFAYSRDAVNPRRVDAVVGEPRIAARLRDLVKAGAHIYVCGRATFSRTVMDCLADALDEPGRPGRVTVRDLVGHGRYLQDVFTTYTGSSAEPKPRVDASELVSRRTRRHGVWQAIAGRVYDLTEFETIHPGGHKIIDSYAGMDATSSYRTVGHHLDPEVEAMLAMYEIGVMRRLDFGARFAIAVGENGLEHLSLEDLYRRWARHLYALAEISNAHTIDVSVNDEPLRRAEENGARAPTAYRLQLGIESHARFLAQTVPMVCRRFAALWRTTSGPCSLDESFDALVDQLEQVLVSPAAVQALAGAKAMEEALDTGATAGLPERLTSVTVADASYLDAATRLVASGVKLFEIYEREVLAHGAAELLAIIRAFPGLTHDHLGALAGEAGSAPPKARRAHRTLGVG